MTKNIIQTDVIFVLGIGHCGSTILSTIIGNHQDIISVGELCRLPVSGLINNEYCACGKRAQECNFWDKVCAIWQEQAEHFDLNKYIALQKQFERITALPKLLLIKKKLNPEFRQYADATLALFRAIKSVSGKSVIIDSSKNPTRALALLNTPGINLRIIHLVRDARGVAWSQAKKLAKNEQAGIQKSKTGIPLIKTAFRWNRINLQSSWTTRHTEREHYLRIRYEDFVNKPDDVLSRIGSLFKMDFSKVINSIETETPFLFGHTIAGNRVRMSGKILLKPDVKWSSQMSFWQKMQVQMVTGWLMRLYGYRR